MKEAKLQKKLLYHRLMLSFLTILFTFGTLSAQERTVSGIIKDTSGETIIGASVMVKGSKIGTVTNVDGAFKLNVPANAKLLVIKYLGMEKQEVPITYKVLNITLNNDNKSLDEVVVIGYGTAKKRDLTGVLSSINKETLKNIPATNVAEAIAGRMAGVQVTTTEGSPDATVTIRVRGGGSISQDNSPLIVACGCGNRLPFNVSRFEPSC